MTSRGLLCVFGIVLAGHPLGAQARRPQHGAPEWSELRTAPGVDSIAVRWIDANMSAGERDTLLALLGRLSHPDAVQLLPSLAYLEGSTTQRYVRAFIDSMSVRPPNGAAGVVRSMYLLARHRHAVPAIGGASWADSAGVRPLTLPTAASLPAQRGAAVHLSIDASPARTILRIVRTPDIAPSAIMPQLASPAFDALIQHHGQSFYPVPLSREQLALDLSHAASTQPLDLLYMYARPGGFFHFADVRRYAPRYRTMIAALESSEPAVSAYVSRAISPYLPPGTQVLRRVSLFFNDGADGWAANGVAAVPLEYYKDDYPRLFNTMVHETFHAAQRVVASAARTPERTLRSGADSAFAAAAGILLAEGTANYVAPTLVRSAASADSMTAVGADLMAQLAALRGGAWDPKRAQALLNRGVESGGPFYWLGAAMTRRLVERRGTIAVGQALQGDGLEFMRAYSSATEDTSPSLLTPAVVQAFTEIAATTRGSAPAGP